MVAPAWIVFPSQNSAKPERGIETAAAYNRIEAMDMSEQR